MNILEEIQNCPVEWKELGEVVEVLDSLRRPITKSQRIPGDIPYYGANGIQDYVKDWIFDGTFILMGEDGSVIKNDIQIYYSLEFHREVYNSNEH